MLDDWQCGNLRVLLAFNRFNNVGRLIEDIVWMTLLIEDGFDFIVSIKNLILPRNQASLSLL